MAERLDTALEKLLGPLLSEAMAGSYGTDEDPLLAPWIRRIGGEVAAFAPRDDLKPRFTLLASSVTNALALPGGSVGEQGAGHHPADAQPRPGFPIRRASGLRAAPASRASPGSGDLLSCGCRRFA